MLIKQVIFQCFCQVKSRYSCLSCNHKTYYQQVKAHVLVILLSLLRHVKTLKEVHGSHFFPNTVEPPLKGTSCRWTPPVGGHLLWADTSCRWTPPVG